MNKRDKTMLNTIVEKCEVLNRTTRDEGLKAALKIALDALKVQDGAVNAS